MSARHTLESIFILHTRPFRNTSLIVEILSKQHGRIAAVARSARGPKSRYKGMLQLFSPLTASWGGSQDLKYLSTVERNGPVYPLEDRNLVCGFYLNELLMRLLQRDDPCPMIFELYQESLKALIQDADQATILRRFEKNLLQSLGYGIPFEYDSKTHDPIDATKNYAYDPDHGFFESQYDETHTLQFPGNTLLNIAKENFTDPNTQQAAKRIFRIALSQHLGNKPIMSRELL